MESNRYFFLKELGHVSEEAEFVFVILPFVNTLIFEKIVKPAAESCGLVCQKADDIFRSGSVMEKVAEQIQRASILVADLSGRNPNVFYELGLAHALGKKVILITQSHDDVPTDLKALEYLHYDTSRTEAIHEFSAKLEKLFEETRKGIRPIQTRSDITDIHADRGNEQLFDASFLKNTEGALSFWVEVTEDLIAGTANQWLFSHCANNGQQTAVTIESESEEEPKTEQRYLNVFAFQSGPRNEGNPDGLWGFLCTDSRGNPNRIHDRRKLPLGWHMFTLTWSKTDNSIKFYIDKTLSGQTIFRCWPEEIEAKCVIGTWPNKAAGHYIGTRIGRISVFESAIDFDQISTLNDEETSLPPAKE